MDSYEDVAKAPPARVMFIVASAIPAVLPLLTFVLWFMKQDGLDGVSLDPVEIGVFAAIAFATLPFAIWLRRRSLHRSPESVLRRYPATTPKDVPLQIISTAVVTGMAIPEVSVLIGFVAGYMTMDWAYFIPFALYGVIGWAVMYPRRQQVRDWYAEFGGSVPPMNA